MLIKRRTCVPGPHRCSVCLWRHRKGPIRVCLIFNREPVGTGFRLQRRPHVHYHTFWNKHGKSIHYSAGSCSHTRVVQDKMDKLQVSSQKSQENSRQTQLRTDLASLYFWMCMYACTYGDGNLCTGYIHVVEHTVYGDKSALACMHACQ